MTQQQKARYLTIAVIGTVGGLAWGFGAILTVPLATGATAAAYADRRP